MLQKANTPILYTTSDTIKMKPSDVQVDRYFEYGAEHNDKDPKFQVGDHVRI